MYLLKEYIKLRIPRKDKSKGFSKVYYNIKKLILIAKVFENKNQKKAFLESSKIYLKIIINLC